jgi:triosephosphate isomerase
MKIGHEALVIGNWKMNPQTDAMAKRLALDVKKSFAREDVVEVVIAPPSIFIPTVQAVRNSGRAFQIGAQNVHAENLGAFTGEISLPMGKSFDVSHVIVGHSERRRMGESDTEVNTKTLAVIKAGLTAVVCVGEGKRDHAAQYLNDIESQIRTAVRGLSKSKLTSLVIAYEPVWAIGTGQNATPGDVHEMRLFIVKVLADIYGRNYAQKVRVLYGGSVTPKNARELMQEGTIDGFLVGGASLVAKDFSAIVASVRAVCEV